MLVLYSAPFLVLTGVVTVLGTGRFVVLYTILGVLAAALTLALYRDASTSALYTVGSSTLKLSRGNDELVLPASDILDASLVDRTAARDYFRSRRAKHSDGASFSAESREFLRFCTVDIGMRSFTFGLGRLVIDRMPTAKSDLVLLRTREHGERLLSPDLKHDLVDTIMRLQRRGAEAARNEA